MKICKHQLIVEQLKTKLNINNDYNSLFCEQLREWIRVNFNKLNDSMSGLDGPGYWCKCPLCKQPICLYCYDGH